MSSHSVSASKRGSILSRAKRSFYRSHGDRGASVETLRGLHGADFEGPARVTRGGGRRFGSFITSCFCFNLRQSNKEQYLLLKGTNLFVFVKEDSASPKYAIDLTHRKLSLHNNPKHKYHQTVYLEDVLGDVDYEFTFNTEENSLLANNFLTSLREKITICDDNEIKEKLGHKSNFHVSQSMKYACTVAEKKMKDQPEAPISMYNVMVNEPTMSLEAMGNMAY